MTDIAAQHIPKTFKRKLAAAALMLTGISLIVLFGIAALAPANAGFGSLSLRAQPFIAVCNGLLKENHDYIVIGRPLGHFAGFSHHADA